MDTLPNARTSGLSNLTGRPGKPAPRIAAAIGAAAVVLGFGLPGLWVLLTATMALLLCATIARHKIGGQTGDILGATQQVTEIAVLGAICAIAL
jgi:adenosylcobinamide-GDP ribazoletransferase